MSTTTEARTVQAYRVYIRATPEAVWAAITDPAWTARYGYGGGAEYDLQPGGSYRHHASEDMVAHGAPDVVVEGEVIEADPPRKLVQTWRMVMEAGLAAEAFTRLTYEIDPLDAGVTKLTVTHDVTGSPMHAGLVSGEYEGRGGGGGWAWVLSGLKTLLETGAPLQG
jgi:uncharacterized protein YndB with AHSA1/START domain